jgi:hypothetical protein
VLLAANLEGPAIADAVGHDEFLRRPSAGSIDSNPQKRDTANVKTMRSVIEQ